MPATAIVQARMGSTRLPGKVMRPLAGHPMLWHVVTRVRATPGLSGVVVATTESPEDDEIREFCVSEDIAVFCGSPEDVLDRYYRTAREFDADPVVRVTSDCPLVDPHVVGELLEMFLRGCFDHVGVAAGGAARAAGVKGYPDGLDAECFSLAALEAAWRESTEQPDREHVTPYIWGHKDRFRTAMLESETDWSLLRLTVDEPQDLELVERIYSALYREGEPPFAFAEVVRLLSENPELAAVNSRFVGHEKYRDLWAGLSAGSAIADAADIEEKGRP